MGFPILHTCQPQVKLETAGVCYKSRTKDRLSLREGLGRGAERFGWTCWGEEPR
jgi:hypothetical protein